MTGQSALSFQSFTKRYDNGQGVFDLSLDVDEGEWFGFIGENGAGKSTTIRTALGLLRATSGAIRILGHDVVAHAADSHTHAVRARVGYVPSEPGLWDGMTVGETLAYLGSFHSGDLVPRRRALLEALELDPARDAVDLSLGNKKKVALVAALQHQPPLLILDEPTNGLDPLMQQRLFELLKEAQKGGATVFFSSHVLAEVERVCTRVAILKQGRLVQVSSLDDLKEKSVRRIELIRADVAAATTLGLDGVSEVVIDGHHARFLYGGPLKPLLEAITADDVDDVRLERPSLEEIVMRHYGDGREQKRQPAAS